MGHRAWGRLLDLDHRACFGSFECTETIVIIGHSSNPDAAISIDADRIGHEHCTLSLDPDRQVWLKAGPRSVWLDRMQLCPGEMRTLVTGSRIFLLPPDLQGATCRYQFMWVDMRRHVSQEPAPVLPPRLLAGTSFDFSEQPDAPSIHDYEAVAGADLGQGTFGVVKKVVHRSTGVPFAMKVMLKKKIAGRALPGRAPAAAGGIGRPVGAVGRTRSAQLEAERTQLQAKVLSEARILKRVSHANIVRFADVFEDSESICILMEYVDGGDLLDWLNARGPLAEAEARAVFSQLLGALAHVHSSGVMHRDLKPENVLLARGGVGEVPTIKLADFGLAKHCAWQGGTAAGTFCGTQSYVAPEIIECRTGRREYDEACDMWSAGVILHVMLTLSNPFCDGTSSIASALARLHAGLCPDGSLVSTAPVSRAAKDLRSADRLDLISPAAKDLMRRLLEIDPCLRLTAERACAHPWISGATTIDPDDETDDVEEADDDAVFVPAVSGPSSAGKSAALSAPAAAGKRRWGRSIPGRSAAARSADSTPSQAATQRSLPRKRQCTTVQPTPHPLRDVSGTQVAAMPPESHSPPLQSRTNLLRAPRTVPKGVAAAKPRSQRAAVGAATGRPMIPLQLTPANGHTGHAQGSSGKQQSQAVGF